jgi:hypothetical protein
MQSVRDTTKTGGAQAANATGAAARSIGNAGGPATVFGFPLVVPPSGLVGKLMDIPATWGTAGSALEAGVTPAALVALVPGLAPAKIKGGRELYSRAFGMVDNAAAEAAKQVSADLLNTVISPVITAGVTDLQTSIRTEVNRVLGTPPSGVAALGSNPAMAALVSAMKARLDADKAASAGGGRDPVGHRQGRAGPGRHLQLPGSDGLAREHEVPGRPARAPGEAVQRQADLDLGGLHGGGEVMRRLATVRWQSPPPTAVDEELAGYDDGTVWLVVRGSRDGSATVGTWSVTPSADEHAALVAAGDVVVDLLHAQAVPEVA